MLRATQIINHITRRIHTLLLYTVSQKNLANLYLSELCKISTKFDYFWQKDG